MGKNARKMCCCVSLIAATIIVGTSPRTAKAGGNDDFPKNYDLSTQLKENPSETIKVQLSFSRFSKSMMDGKSLDGSARFVPFFNHSVVVGFKFLSVGPKSIFMRLGLKKGDILLAVDGAPLNTSEGLGNLFGDPKQKRDGLDLLVYRKNKFVKINIRFI